MLSISSLSKTLTPLTNTNQTPSFFFFLSPSSLTTQTHFLKHSPQTPPLLLSLSSRKSLILTKASNPEAEPETAKEEDEWLSRLPDKKKPLYAHSLPCIEAWLKSLGFYQSKEDRAVWFVENPGWRAQLSLDITDLYIRYLKNGPGNLEKDMERRFSYALSREDIENAVLGGP